MRRTIIEVMNMLKEIIILEYKRKLKPHLNICAQFKSLIQVCDIATIEMVRQDRVIGNLFKDGQSCIVKREKGDRPLRDNLTEGDTKFIKNWYF